ncbi:hypothetical protein HanPSC8_Chr11g0453681 [Helianthus annuus]|nr:hypothetical protein HanPSC8_Chr11g0453681 [Helianthus annuus]
MTCKINMFGILRLVKVLFDLVCMFLGYIFSAIYLTLNVCQKSPNFYILFILSLL